jgi:hypothetical protein
MPTVFSLSLVVVTFIKGILLLKSFLKCVFPQFSILWLACFYSILNSYWQNIKVILITSYCCQVLTSLYTWGSPCGDHHVTGWHKYKDLVLQVVGSTYGWLFCSVKYIYVLLRNPKKWKADRIWQNLLRKTVVKKAVFLVMMIMIMIRWEQKCFIAFIV